MYRKFWLWVGSWFQHNYVILNWDEFDGHPNDGHVTVMCIWMCVRFSMTRARGNMDEPGDKVVLCVYMCTCTCICVLMRAMWYWVHVWCVWERYVIVIDQFPRFICSIEALIPWGFALGICVSVLHTNLGSWSITITSSPFISMDTINMFLALKNVCPGPQELYNSKHVDMNPTRRGCIT